VTAVRHDAYALAHPLKVERAKPALERGYYMHPELYGQPGEKSVGGRHHLAAKQRTGLQTVSARRGAGGQPATVERAR
jgi:hypothetical protein